MAEVSPEMKRPEEVNLSREEGEALIERLESDRLSANDRQVLAQVLRLYSWLLFMLQESKLSLKRFRAMLFGDKPKKRDKPSSEGSADVGRSYEGGGAASSEACW